MIFAVLLTVFTTHLAHYFSSPSKGAEVGRLNEAT